MKQGVSQLRNPVIARVFRELELVEQWGSGIPGIFLQAANAKLPEPIIEELAGRLRFTVFLPEILPLSREQARGSNTAGARSSSGEAPVEASVEAPVEAPVELSQTEAKILSALADQPLSTKELLKTLGYTQKTGNYKQSIERLLKQELVAYTLPEKPNSRLQKYRLTPKGQRASQTS